MARVRTLALEPLRGRHPAFRRRPSRPGRPGSASSGATLILAAWAGAACSTEERVPGPSLVCDSPVIDLGAVWEGALLLHEFLLASQGDEAVRVLSSTADCGCTVTRIERRLAGGRRAPYELGTPLPPGEELAVPVEVATRGKPGRTPRNVHLVLGDGSRLTLSVQAEVRPWLVAEPSRLDPVSFPEGESGQLTFHVRQAEGRPFALTAERIGLPPWIEVVARPVAGSAADGRAERFLVRVDFTPETPRGTRGYVVQLASDDEIPEAPRVDGRAPVFRLLQEVAVEVLGPLSLEPPRLTFGVVRPHETVARSVRLVCHDEDFVLGEPRVRIEPLTADGPFLLGPSARLRTRQVAGQNAWDIELSLSDLDPLLRGNIFARLVVETGHPRLPELQASVLGVALGPPAAPRGGG